MTLQPPRLESQAMPLHASGDIFQPSKTSIKIIVTAYSAFWSVGVELEKSKFAKNKRKN